MSTATRPPLREAVPRTNARPAGDEGGASRPLQPQQPAVADLTQRQVPPIICPKCGRGMTPRVERWRPPNGNGIEAADCQCSLNGCSFVYTPASVRIKE